MQTGEILKSANIDPGTVSAVNQKLEDFLTTKNRQIKDLQYDLVKVTKAHNGNFIN